MQGIPREPGSYVLVVWLPQDARIHVGRLGEQRFPAGWYLYAGSALGGLDGRVRRHLRADKRPHWHIDRLVAHAPVRKVWLRVGSDRLECIWASALARLPAARAHIDGFGASDCSCATHLFWCARRPALAEFRTLVGAPLRCIVVREGEYTKGGLLGRF